TGITVCSLIGNGFSIGLSTGRGAFTSTDPGCDTSTGCVEGEAMADLLSSLRGPTQDKSNRPRLCHKRLIVNGPKGLSALPTGAMVTRAGGRTTEGIPAAKSSLPAWGPWRQKRLARLIFLRDSARNFGRQPGDPRSELRRSSWFSSREGSRKRA